MLTSRSHAVDDSEVNPEENFKQVAWHSVSHNYAG